MLEHTRYSVYLKTAIHWHGNRYRPTERIGVYRVHPVASLFPLIEGEEFDELVENIEAFGQKVPIVLDEGVLIDGSNRLRAGVQ